MQSQIERMSDVRVKSGGIAFARPYFLPPAGRGHLTDDRG